MVIPARMTWAHGGCSGAALVILLCLTLDLHIWGSGVSLLVSEPLLTRTHARTNTRSAPTSTHPCLAPSPLHPPPQPSEDLLSAGLSPSAPAWYPRRIGGRGSGWVEIQRAVIYSERHGENKNRGLSLLLFVVPVCLSLSLCAAAAYACVCPSSVSACRDDYHRCIIPPNDRRLTPTSPFSLPACSAPSPHAVIALASVRVS